MAVTKNKTLRRYKGGSTLEVPCNNSSGLLGIGEAQRLLGIHARDTINEYRKALGLFSRDYINWQEFKELLMMQTFLGLKHGYNSKEMFLVLRDQGRLNELFTGYSIDIEAKFERLQSDYHKQQRQRQA